MRAKALHPSQLYMCLELGSVMIQIRMIPSIARTRRHGQHKSVFALVYVV